MDFINKLNPQYIKKIKEIATIVGILCTAVAAMWGAFKPEKKAQASYIIMSDRIVAMEKEIDNLYDLTGAQQKQLGFLLDKLGEASAPIAAPAATVPSAGVGALKPSSKYSIKVGGSDAAATPANSSMGVRIIRNSPMPSFSDL